MTAIRKLLLPLAALAAMLPSAGLAADFSEEQYDEMGCVYLGLGDDQYDEVVQFMFSQDGTDNTATAAVAAARADCANYYGWTDEVGAAAEEYMFAALAYEVALANVSTAQPEKLDAVLGTLDADYISTFTVEGQKTIPDMDAWRARTGATLAEAGVEEKDRDVARFYMMTRIDLEVIRRAWAQLFNIVID